MRAWLSCASILKKKKDLKNIYGKHGATSHIYVQHKLMFFVFCRTVVIMS